MIICYQYEIGHLGGEIKPITHYAKNIVDVFNKFYIGKDGYCKAVAGWRIKKEKPLEYQEGERYDFELCGDYGLKNDK